MTWRVEPSESGTFAITTSTGAVSRATFVAALADDRAVRLALTNTLRASPYAAFAWEMPALSAATSDRDAVFAIIDSPELARVHADPSPFAAQLAQCDRIATFANLGGDATLIVPSPRAAPDAAHLAAFIRSASVDIIDDLWSAVGRAVMRRRAAKPDPVWISTAGLGVHWLHVRLDDRPKYYRHRAFTNPAA
ncbi:MAG: hypothetical protein AB7R00_19860 [Kofleriaceae bacterium]